MNRFRNKRVLWTVLSALAGAAALWALDQDGGGISDVWEAHWGTGPLMAWEDPDQDGFSSEEEYYFDTNPLDPTSKPTVGIASPAPNDMQVYFFAPMGQWFDIEVCDDLVEGYWGSLYYDLFSGNHAVMVHSEDPTGVEKRFFQVVPYGASESDGDKLDSFEEFLLNTDPDNSDSDNDGMDDGFEFTYQFNPLSPVDGPQDADSDQLSNVLEAELGLNPRLADSDGDGLADGDEDRDWDGLANLQELLTYGTDPAQPDTDLDTLPDGWEVDNGFSPTVHNGSDGDPANDPGSDPDHDGLTNTQEADHGTQANNADTDGDGVSDAVEVAQGSNPKDPNDSQPPPQGTVPVNITFGDDSGSHSEKYRVQLTPLEGDSGGVRYRTNRAYGQPQTDTFRLPKGAKYKVELIHVGTKPQFMQEYGFSNYDWTLDIDISVGCLVVEDPDAIVITIEDWPNSTFLALGKSATLYVPRFEWVTPKESPVSAPDDSGDGQNEFTYDAGSPGVLAVDLKVLAKPTGVAQAAGHDGLLFSERCLFTLPAISGSTLTWDAANPGGMPEASGEHLIARATYTTLPANNSDFGLKQAQFQCDDDTSVLPQGLFEVFFPKDSYNHPEFGPYPIDRPPNWHYYWRVGGVCGIPSTAQYDSSASFGYTRPGVDNILRLGPLAPTTNSGPETFTGSSPYGSVTVTGTGKGIQCVAETVAHEVYHLTLYDILAGRTDGDGDGIAYADEATLDGINSNPSDPDTFNLRSIHQDYAAYGDNEVRCRKKELSPGITVNPSEDWANPGSQCLTQFGPVP